MEYIAHYKAETNEVQTVKEHCKQTAVYAGNALAFIKLQRAGYIAGLLHDMGKMTSVFQNYIRDDSKKRGSVIHTFQGCRFLLERYHSGTGLDDKDIACELLSYAVGAHHGLFDCVDEHHKSGFAHRLEQGNIGYEEAVENFKKECASLNELDYLFNEASDEFKAVMEKIQQIGGNENNEDEAMFYLGLLSRLLLSAVIEGDRRDTAEFMSSVQFQNFDYPLMWERCLKRVEKKLNEFPCITPIQNARRIISDQCKRFADNPSGVYRLNVPTGAGKTLSSLRYALAHAAKWNKSRIIFTSPLLSILEQNAAVIRQYIQDNSIILEHHSNVIKEQNGAGELNSSELLAENWNAPIIITTMVQLLNTLFDGKTTCIRRFHALCNSIIVVDEVQTVPNNMVGLFNLAINFLSNICGATIVLCSATQPCSEEAEHSICGDPKDIVSYDPELWKAFERTKLVDVGSKRLDEMPDFVYDVIDEAESLLIVCNKKDEAEKLYAWIQCDEYRCFHLSASMCIAHRRKVLVEIQKSLELGKKDGAKTICVSTQVIEAGVDISFARVIRLTAGMESIVQAAGRCNRNGESADAVPVYIVQCEDENLNKLKDIERAKNATLHLLRTYQNNPGSYDNNLASYAAIRYYYHCLYKEMPLNYQNFVVSYHQRPVCLFDLLSYNEYFANAEYLSTEIYRINQAFALAGQLFEVFDNSAVDVLVPYGDGKNIIMKFNEISTNDHIKFKTLLNEAKAYMVSVYSWQIQELVKEQALISLCGGSVTCLQEGYYNENTGFTLKKGKMDFLYLGGETI